MVSGSSWTLFEKVQLGTTLHNSAQLGKLCKDRSAPISSSAGAKRAKQCSHVLRSSQSCLQHAVHVLVCGHDDLLDSCGLYCTLLHFPAPITVMFVDRVCICLDCQRADSCRSWKGQQQDSGPFSKPVVFQCIHPALTKQTPRRASKQVRAVIYWM